MKRPLIVIVGGLGYIGSRLASNLQSTSALVVAVTSLAPDGEHPEGLDGVDVRFLDLTDQESVARAVVGADIVVHCAALNEHSCLADPEAALLVNGLGTLRLVEASVAAGVRRFIYFSTAHVYRTPLTGTIDETILPRPVSPYAVTHRVAEDFVLAARAKGTLESIVVRLSNAFGAPLNRTVDRWTLLVNDLCRQAVVRGRLELKTAGLQTRDFIPLAGVCSAAKHLIDLPDDQLNDGIFNVGCGTSMTVRAMADRVRARCEVVLGKEFDLVLPTATFDERSEPLEYRIDKLRKSGFQPTSPDAVDAEIDATLRFCVANYS